MTARLVTPRKSDGDPETGGPTWRRGRGQQCGMDMTSTSERTGDSPPHRTRISIIVVCMHCWSCDAYVRADNRGEASSSYQYSCSCSPRHRRTRMRLLGAVLRASRRGPCSAKERVRRPCRRTWRKPDGRERGKYQGRGKLWNRVAQGDWRLMGDEPKGESAENSSRL